jgi:hypothetical protein
MIVPSLAAAGGVVLFPATDGIGVFCCAQPSTVSEAANIVPAAVVFRKSRRLSIDSFIAESFFSFRFGCIYNRREHICYRPVVFLDRGSFMTFGALPRAPVTAAVCSPMLVWVPFLYVPIGLMYISLLVIKGRSFRNAKLDKICPRLVSAVLFHLCWVSSLLQ